MALEKLSNLSKKAIQLIEAFDQSALNWGWVGDRGIGSQVDTSYNTYKKDKENLIKYIEKLEKNLKYFKINKRIENRKKEK